MVRNRLFEEHFHRILSAELFQIAIRRLQFAIQFNPLSEKVLLFRSFLIGTLDAHDRSSANGLSVIRCERTSTTIGGLIHFKFIEIKNL